MRCNFNVGGRSYLKGSIMYYSSVFILRDFLFFIDVVIYGGCFYYSYCIDKDKIFFNTSYVKKGYFFWLLSVFV